MAVIPDVTPGDLITAQFMNQILHRLADLESRGGTEPAGQVVVPLVIGQTLSQARAILLAPSEQLAIGAVLDVAGEFVDSILPANSNRRVIMQMPSSGTRVAANTSVALVIAASLASTPPAKPRITALDKPSVAVGQPLTIQGENFAVPFGDNTVTFDGAAAPLTGGNSKQLFVTIPGNIPNAPAPGAADKPGVKIVVTNAGGSSDTFNVTIKAPVANAPSISTITPATGFVGQSIVITGSGFSDTLAKNVVTFDDDNVPGDVTAAQPTQLTVTVPAMSGLTQPDDRRLGVVVKVSNTDVPGATAVKSHNFRHN